VVKSLPEGRPVIFVPDKYLGRWVQRQTGREMILYDGWCPIHMELKEQGIEVLKREHPQALVVAHPESPIEVSSKADLVASTEQMVRAVKQSQAMEFIIATETGILHKMRKENPDKRFYAANDLAICPHMKMNDLEKVLSALQNLAPEVKVPESIRARAFAPIQRMLDLKLPYIESFWGCKC
jgi:quinolinate synthase